MKRVFGKKKEKGPAPSLSEAGGRVDERVTKIDEKVQQYDPMVDFFTPRYRIGLFSFFLWLTDARCHEPPFLSRIQRWCRPCGWCVLLFFFCVPA